MASVAAGRRSRPALPPGISIFLSYRREDSAGHAGRLHQDLTKRFGTGAMFRDLDTIPAGADFVEVINAALRQADVALVLIGPRWASITDESGRRRLDDPDDFVRREVQACLGQSTWTIPVLVGGARMPREEELPEPLRPLTRRNAVELSDRRWVRDVHELMAVLARSRGLVRRITDTQRRVRDFAYRATRPRVLVPVAAVVVAILVFILTQGGGSSPAARLTALIPASIRSHCTTTGSSTDLYPSVGAVASARCTLPVPKDDSGSGQPQVIDYALFTTTQDLKASYNDYLSTNEGSSVTTYNHGAVSGTWGVGEVRDGGLFPEGGNFLLYTANQPLVLVLAETAGGNLQTWFQTGAGDPGT